MFGNNQVCPICASESGVKGFIYRGTIKLIGSNCLLNHMSESDVDHNFVDLDLALRMQADPSLMVYYLDQLPKLHKAIHFLRNRR